MQLLSLLALLTLLVVSPADARQPHPRHAPRPNILVIMSDDQGSFDLSLRGSGIRTPNIDSIARDGVELTHFYTQPFCVPTRAAFMTGVSDQPWMYRIQRLAELLPPDMPTLAERFQRGGYETALMGKWHLGLAPESHPNVRGFDHFYGHLGGLIDYFTKESFDIVIPTGEHDWQRNGVQVFEDGYATTQIADETIALLEARVEEGDRRPFFYFVSFNAPHGPWSAPEEALLPGCTVGLCVYRAVVEQMDREIGRILAALDDLALDGETVVFFLIDNGGSSFTNNGPFRRGKFQTLEGGIRVPAFVRYPRRLLRHQVNAPMHVQDLWATFEAAAGLHKESPSTSVNRWLSVQGYGRRHRPPMFFSNQRADCEAGCFSHFVRPFGVFFTRSSAVIRWPWKLRVQETLFGNLVVLDSQSFELYNLRRDPYEDFDRAADRPELVRRLGAELMSWESQGEAPRSHRRAHPRRRGTTRD